ncbi:hypothetical protein [Arthrobacter sp. H14]|uniref:hypothetical protein n=1 Tax=Arthrobacter sp. H14 TaxID=1312959 RepID=UPI0012DD1E00|nr:hypothetical protein [Arthrobacter sp. H14]
MSDENDKSVEPIEVEDLGITVEVDDEGLHGDEGSNPSITAMMDEQDREAEQFAVEFLKEVIRLRGVRIDRVQFLKAELHKRGIGPAEIDRAIRENPAVAGVSPVMLDEIAESAIDFETGKSTALSFAAGLPGGFAMIGTVPADITQFYVHAFRVMQKIAYVYGWQSFLNDLEDIDDETLGKLAVFLGVMMGVGGASSSLGLFAVQVARPAVQKKIAGVALTKTTWCLPMKQTLRILGVQVTKQSFAKTVSKIVPLVGGVVSGGLTFVTLSIQSRRLMTHLRVLPPPNVDAEAYLAAVNLADEMAPSKTKALADTFEDVGSTIKGTASRAADKFRSSHILDEGIPDASEVRTKAKNLGGAIAGTAGTVGANVTGLFKSKKKQQSDADSSQSEDVAGENHAGILTEQ